MFIAIIICTFVKSFATQDLIPSADIVTISKNKINQNIKL